MQLAGMLITQCHVTLVQLSVDKSVIARGIAAEGGDSAYPGVFAMEPKMLPRDFLFDTACNSSELA